MGAPFVPTNEGERTKLQMRLTHAGLYSRQAMVYYFGVKVLLMTAPAMIGLVHSSSLASRFQAGFEEKSAPFFVRVNVAARWPVGSVTNAALFQ